MDTEELTREFPWLGYLGGITTKIVETLYEKERTYRGSWQRRGGAGAFMMLARKWDRIEAQSKAQGYDIFKAVEVDGGKEGVIDDIDDLIGYLLLVRAEASRRQEMEDSIRQGRKAGVSNLEEPTGQSDQYSWGQRNL